MIKPSLPSPWVAWVSQAAKVWAASSQPWEATLTTGVSSQPLVPSHHREYSWAVRMVQSNKRTSWMMRSARECWGSRRSKRSAREHCLWSWSKKRKANAHARQRAAKRYRSGAISAERNWNWERRPTRRARRCIMSRWISRGEVPTRGNASLPTARWTGRSM